MNENEIKFVAMTVGNILRDSKDSFYIEPTKLLRLEARTSLEHIRSECIQHDCDSECIRAVLARWIAYYAFGGASVESAFAIEI